MTTSEATRPQTRRSVLGCAALGTALLACGARTGLPESDTGSPAGSGGSAGRAAAGSPAAGRCQPGEPLRRLAFVNSAYGLALDVDDVYVAQAFDLGGASRVSKDGGPAKPLIDKQGRPLYVAIDPTHVFLTNTIAGQVLRIDKDGSNPLEIAAQQHFPAGVVTREGGVYWLYDSSPGGALMRRLPSDSGPVVVKDALASPTVLRQRGEVLYMVLHGGIGAQPPAIATFDVATGGYQVIGQTSLQANDLAVADDGTPFYTTNVGAFRLNGDGSSTQLGKGSFVDGIAVAGDDVYYVERGTSANGRLVRHHPPTGTQTTLAEKQQSPRKIAVDETCVYFTNGEPGGKGGDLMRLGR